MADPVFHEAQWSRRYEGHIAPVNRLVDLLRGCDRGWVPYVAPMYGGVDAQLLSLLQDPGPMTQAAIGSGFLSMENDDETAERLDELFAGAGFSAADSVIWNAYPWYINRKPKAAELEAGVEPLMALVKLLPNLRVVMLHGGSAQASWKRFTRRHPSVSGRLRVIPTYHTGKRAFIHKDAAIRQARRDHLLEAFKLCADYLDGSRRA